MAREEVTEGNIVEGGSDIVRRRESKRQRKREIEREQASERESEKIER